MCKKLIFLIPFVFTLVAIAGLASAEEIWLEAESADPLTTPMETLSDDPNASGGEYIGAVSGTATASSAAPAPNGTASYIIDVAGGTYKLVVRTKCDPRTGDASGSDDLAGADSCWIRIDGATMNSTVLVSGFFKMNDTNVQKGVGRQWEWLDAFNSDDSFKVMEFTLDPGQYSLEVCYREDGMYFDAFLLTTDLALDAATLPAEIPSGSSCVEANLLTNGGFEDGYTGSWGFDNDSPARETHEIVGDAQEGSNALKISVTNHGTNGYEPAFRYDNLTFEAGKKYTFSVFLKGSTDGMKVTLKPEDSGNYTAYGQVDKTITTEWVEYSTTTPVMTSTVSPADLSIWIGYQNGDIYVDHARWYEGDYVAPCPPESGGVPAITGTCQSATINTDWAATPQDVTALSTDGDWRLWNDTLGAPAYEKNTSKELIGDLSIVGTFSLYNTGTDQNFSWSDGVNPASSSSTPAGIGSNGGVPDGEGYQVDVTLPTGTGDITVWTGTRACYGHLVILDGSTEVFSIDGGDRGTVWGIDRFDIAVSNYAKNTTLTIKWVIAPGESNGSGRAQFYGVALFSKPGGGGPAPAVVKATKPQPASGTSNLTRQNMLSWTAGDYAVSHNVYLGTDQQTVKDAIVDNPLGVLVSQQQADAFYDFTTADYGTTYYWRIDEVGEDGTIYPGDVWSFSTKVIGLIIPQASITVTASGEKDADQGAVNTINGSGLNAQNQHGTDNKTMWLSQSAAAPNEAWIQYDFDNLYKLPQMLIWNHNLTGLSAGYAIKGVTIEYSADGGATWTVLADVNELPKGTGKDTLSPIVVDLGGVADGLAATSIRITANSNWSNNGMLKMYGLSEVKFYYIPVWPTNPSPANGATGVGVNPKLAWKPGEGVVQHKVYFGTDETAVTDGTASFTLVDSNNWSTPGLTLGQKYFWRVEEVNMASVPSVWSGGTWNFTVSDYRVVDDFEGYTSSINKWSSGSSGSSNGGSIGPVETSIVNNGSKSMKFMFDNRNPFGSSVYYSEVSVKPGDLACGSNWQTGSPKWLVFWIYGNTANTNTEKFYVKINDAMYYYPGFPMYQLVPVSEVLTPWWTQVTVQLVSSEVSLNNVSNLKIGFTRTDLDKTGTGVIYIDDIRLYKDAPVPLVPVNPGDANQVAWYKMQNNANDSSGKGHNGTAIGEPNYVSGPFSGYGKAMEFDANDDCVDLGSAEPFNFTGSFSISMWANIKTWSTDWGHIMIATRGENSQGFAVRKGGLYWAGFMQGIDGKGLCFTTRGIPLAGLASWASPEDMMAAPPKLNEWIHIVCVYDQVNNVKKVYYNGKLARQAATVADSALLPSTFNASIGARANSDNTAFESRFNGMLDEVRVYNKALTDAEIRFLCDPTP